MKILIWILVILLVAIFATVLVREILHHSPPDEKDYEGMAAAGDLRVYELLSFVLFCLVYYSLCRLRLEVFDPILRIITAGLITIVLFTILFWWGMTVVFHAYRPDKSLPFECFMSAFVWATPTVVLTMIGGCMLNWFRARQVAR